MSRVRELLKHSSHYFSGQVMVLLASLISYPIFVRYFSVDDYGILGFATTTLMIVVPFAKLGLAHSAVRFYFDYEKGGSLRIYYSTLVLAALAITSACVLIYSGVLIGLIAWLGKTKVLTLLLFLAVLVAFQAPNSLLVEFFRASKRSREYNAILVVRRYLSLGLSMVVLFLFVKNVYGRFIGPMVVDGIVMVWLLSRLLRKRLISFRVFSRGFLRESVKYSLPLSVIENVQQLLSQGDRFLILLYLGAGPLGLYVAIAELVRYLTTTLHMTLNKSLVPIYLEIWAEQGEAETSRFLSHSLHYYLMIAIPIVVGFVAISRDLVVLVASEKYIDGCVVIPYILVGRMVYSVGAFFTSAFYIHKRTMLITGISLGAVGMNVVMNMVLIPVKGIEGAAIASMISYLGMFCVVYYSSRKMLKIDLHMKKILMYCVLAAGMVWCIGVVRLDAVFLRVVLKVLMGAVVYFGAVMILDVGVKRAVFSSLRGLFLKEGKI